MRFVSQEVVRTADFFCTWSIQGRHVRHAKERGECLTVGPKGNTPASPDCKPTETCNKDTRQVRLRKGSRSMALQQFTY